MQNMTKYGQKRRKELKKGLLESWSVVWIMILLLCSSLWTELKAPRKTLEGSFLKIQIGIRKWIITTVCRLDLHRRSLTLSLHQGHPKPVSNSLLVLDTDQQVVLLHYTHRSQLVRPPIHSGHLLGETPACKTMFYTVHVLLRSDMIDGNIRKIILSICHSTQWEYVLGKQWKRLH